VNLTALALEVDSGELAACADLFAAAAGSAAAPRVRCARHGPDGLLLSVPTLPMTLFNRLFGLGLTAGPDPALLDGLPARLGDAMVPRWAVQPAPGALGDAWREWLGAHGYEPRLQRLAQMARDLRAEPQPAVDPAPGLEVHEVGPLDAARFAGPVVAGFGLPAWCDDWLRQLPGRPGWHCMVASRDGEPVAGAALHLRGAHAWLGIAATAPRQRRQGAQRSLMLARLARATALGCRIATTETGAPEPGQPHPSYSNMLGCGFRQVATRTSWARPA
jgi:hypothetical protein